MGSEMCIRDRNCETCGERCEKCKSLESRLRKKVKECESLIQQIKEYQRTLGEEVKDDLPPTTKANCETETEDEDINGSDCSFLLVEEESYENLSLLEQDGKEPNESSNENAAEDSKEATTTNKDPLAKLYNNPCIQ